MDNSIKNWEDFAKKQTDSLLKLKLENEQLKNKIKHLEGLVQATPAPTENSPASSPFVLASHEEELCKIEIARLFEDAKKEPLSWEETRAFEVYVKLLLQIRGKSPEDFKNKKPKQQLSQEHLLQLAAQVVDDTDTEQ